MPVPANTSQTNIRFTLDGMRRGAIAALSIAVSVFIYGVVFGLLARTAELSMLEALAMSSLVFSGSAQIVAVNGISSGTIPTGTAALAIMTTILLLNARYLLYGAAIRPWLGQVRPLPAYLTLALMGDSNWILSMKRYADGETDAGFVFGSGAAMFVPWLAGTALGLLAGGIAANPKALGLDFMLIAFSAAMAVGMIKSRADVTIIAIAAVAAVLADRWLPAGWTVMIAGIAGGAVAWLRWEPATAP